jgi:hypothetical protein
MHCLLALKHAQVQMEREARFNHYVASLQFYNHSRLDDGFRQRVVCMAGARLAELLPHVTTGERQRVRLSVPPCCTPAVATSAHCADTCCSAAARVATEFLDATRQHYRFAVNAAIVQHEFHTPAGSIHLAAAGIQPVQHQHMVPQQGCVALQQLPPGSAVTRRTSQHPGAAEASAEQLPLQPFAAVLQQLQQASLHAQPRLLAALSAYQGLAAGVAHMQLVDVQMGELQRPMQLGAFLALQRLHLENMVEVLQTAWAIPVRRSRDFWRCCLLSPLVAAALLTQAAPAVVMLCPWLPARCHATRRPRTSATRWCGRKGCQLLLMRSRTQKATRMRLRGTAPSACRDRACTRSRRSAACR